MNFKLTINDAIVDNRDILDKVEFITNFGDTDFTFGKFVTPTAKIKLHESINITYGDVVKIYINDAIYGTYESYEIKQGTMSKEVTLYAMTYFALTQTYNPTTTEYTTRSLLLEMQMRIGFVVKDFDSISSVDMNGVTSSVAIDILQSIGMLIGANIVINANGELEFVDLSSPKVYEISPSNITNIVKSEGEYNITRIVGKTSDSDSEPIVVGIGDDANTLTLINPYITEQVCHTILGKLPQYQGIELNIFNAPLFKPFDFVMFEDKGVVNGFPIMNMTLTFGGQNGFIAQVKSYVSNSNDKSSNHKGSMTSKIEVIKNIQSELDTKITIQQGQVSSLISRTDLIEGDMNTIRDAYSEIKQDIGSIESTVGEMVLTSMENLTIGGENLIKNSNFNYGFSGWEGDNLPIFYITQDNMLGYSTGYAMSGEHHIYTEPILVSDIVGKDITFSLEYIIKDKTSLSTNKIASVAFFENDSVIKTNAIAYHDISYPDNYINGKRNTSTLTVQVPQEAKYARVYVIGSNNITGNNTDETVFKTVVTTNGDTVVARNGNTMVAVTAQNLEVTDLILYDKFQLEVGNKATAYKPNVNDATIYSEQSATDLRNELADLSQLLSEANGSDSLTAQMKVKLVSEGKAAHSLYTNLIDLYNSISDTSLMPIKNDLDVVHTNLHNALGVLDVNTNDENGLNGILSLFNNFYNVAEQMNNAINKSYQEVTTMLQTKITQLNDEVSIQISNTNSQLYNLTTRFQFDIDGLTIKSTANASKYIKLDNDSLDFMDGGNMVAQISDQRLNITSASISNDISIGQLKIIPSPNGGLMFIYE